MGEAATKWGLHRHFPNGNLLDKVSILGEGAYPKCVLCGMQTNPIRLGRGHEVTKLCWDGVLLRGQLHARTDAVLALRRQFVVNGNVLDRIGVFQYLGHMLSQDDDDACMVRAQVMKAHKC